jgi:CubicO group peptidase (beta-lactamase class C family)
MTGICVAANGGPSNPAELEAFVDQLFARHLAASRAPGAVFVLVRNGRVMLAKGYGLANVEKRIPVVADRTLFRVASISKLITATAIMQLYERGQIDLHQDVNRYLRAFQLKGGFPRAVTLADVLTHTAGFDGESFGIVARSEAQIVPLGEHLAIWMPPRVMPPGDTWSYSNYGFALAGYVVETTAGQLFPRYVEQNIFRPIGMTRSSFLLPPQLAPDLAMGYSQTPDGLQPRPYYSMNIGPAGALVTTAADMARFMIAHLHEGRYEDARILREETAREMHATHFRPSPDFDGMAFGFVESTRHGTRRLEHSGSIPGFSSLLRIIPAEDTGYFASANGETAFLPELFRELEDRFWPAVSSPDKTAPNPESDDVHRYTGSFRFNVYSRTTSKKTSLLTQPRLLTVTANRDGTLSTNAFFSHPAGRWHEVGPGVFQEAGGEDRMAFRLDPRGRVTLALMEPEAFEREAWYDWRPLHLVFIVTCAALFLSACAGWPIAALVDRFRSRHTSVNGARRNATVLLGAVCALHLAYLPLGGLAITVYERDFGVGVPLAYAVVRGLAFATAAATAAIPVLTAMAWRGDKWSKAARLHYSAVAAAAMLWVPYLVYWNLLGFAP